MRRIGFQSLSSLWVLKRRSLTIGEKALAYSVFGQQLKLDDIQIIAHRLVLQHYAISPNGNIYFNQKDWKDDFAQESIALQSWLIHELVHVWQLQQGIAVVKKALFDRRYQYVIRAGKSFLHYGIEQQAQMVQDYFLKSRTGQNCDDLKTCIPFLEE
ncbi:type IV secretion protein Rhs [Acinetobacter puyangensis]|uniref:Type IV secretion protein Rhs n=1 Tax=Acinetobacter puyangensis TaxID=1096779 RepID=A0A240E8V8_9GAMM|nr:type IV secretion protein Rhs [Acinetobacter puyangensis]SNX44951.1 hypothetical protein SAMN05421731_104318 [Acinetobacter puyangensis]